MFTVIRAKPIYTGDLLWLCVQVSTGVRGTSSGHCDSDSALPQPLPPQRPHAVHNPHPRVPCGGFRSAIPEWTLSQVSGSPKNVPGNPNTLHPSHVDIPRSPTGSWASAFLPFDQSSSHFIALNERVHSAVSLLLPFINSDFFFFFLG